MMHAISLCLVCLTVLSSSQSSATQPAEPAGKLGPPPALSPQPSGVEWPKGAKIDIETALAHYPEDQVSAYLTFKTVLGSKDTALGAAQTEWLAGSLALLEPRVKSVLRRDLSAAASKRDFRAAYIAWLTLAENGFETDRIVAAIPTLAELLKRAVQGAPGIPPVWEISEPRGEFVPSYSDQVFMTTTISIKPEPGRRLLHVTAQVRNVSSSSDPPYVRWSLGELRRAFLSMQEASGGTDAAANGPSRFAGDRFLQVVAQDGQTLPCSYVSSHDAVLGSQWVRMIAGGNPNPAKAESLLRQGQPGSFVAQGAKFGIDVLFAVPEGASEFRLLMFGSPPVPIATQGRSAR